MNNSFADYILYRLEKSDEAFEDAKLLAKNNSWNASINRLYYACYYAVSALLLKNNISAQTHTGIKAQFNLHFIKSGKLSIQYGKLYTDLTDWRYKGDYGDMFDFEQKDVEHLFPLVNDFLLEIKKLISS